MNPDRPSQSVYKTAWKEGYYDALLGRECKAPYSPEWRNKRKHEEYLSGYLYGQEKR